MDNKPDRRLYNPPDHLQEEVGSDEWYEKWFDWMFPTMSNPNDPHRQLWMDMRKRTKREDKR